jgi:hypothetical protein
VAPGCEVLAAGPEACVPESGALGAPEAGTGSGEFVCGHIAAAPNIRNVRSASGERVISNQMIVTRANREPTI